MFTAEQTALFLLKSYSVLSNRTCKPSGHSQLPKGAKIIAMNHSVGCDPLHLPFILKETPLFLLQDGLFEIPFIGWLLKETGQIPVYRGTDKAKEAMNQACSLLKEGKTLAIFPEGKCVPVGQRVAAKTGVIRMALETGVPIIPLGLYVSPKNLVPLKFNWQGSERCGAWQVSGACYIRFGTPWMPKAEADLHAQADELMDRIYSLTAQAERESLYASNSSFRPIPQR